MTDRADPFDRLRASDPAKTVDAEATGMDPVQIFERVVSSTRPDPLSAWRKPRFLVMAGAVLLIAAAYVVFRPVTEPLTVACYQSADLDADIVVVDSPATGTPADVCRPAWSPEGQFGAALGYSSPPDLQACVLETGVVGVFPTASGSQVCSDLGLSVPASGSLEENRAVVELRDELVDAFLEACLDIAEAEAKAQEALARHGLEGWRVIITQTFTEGRPCASLAFDVPARTIELVPISK